MSIHNDNHCSWINDLPLRKNINFLEKNIKCDWLIVGAGYTGLSAARKLAVLNPNQKIILIDSQLAGEGASSRNSGYLVDATLNDGFTSNRDLSIYKKKTDIYKLGISAVRNFIREYQVDCDWNECGKYYASSNVKDKKTLESFSKILSKTGFEHKIIDKCELSKKLGTNFYNAGIYSKGGILLHPGKLARAMVDILPENVELLENTHLIRWKKNNKKIYCEFKNGKIVAEKIIFCTNGFFKSLGIKKRYTFPLTLTASMSRQLTIKEYDKIGKPLEWGVLSIKPMGATIRMTKDKRIMIRNTAEFCSPFKMNKKKLQNRSKAQLQGIKKRFPSLPDDIIESTWSGVVCRSRNSSQIFDKIDNNIFAAGCYNGSGIGVGTLFGEQIAIMANNENTKEIDLIRSRPKPTWLPPEPFLNLGVKARLIVERFKAHKEI